MVKTMKNDQNKILTIPNALSVLRLCLIPILIWSFYVKSNYTGTLVVLLISGFTDILDGFIARKFNMVSDFGKMLDPVADKLTQGAMLFCLLTKFPFIGFLLILLIIKEIFGGLTGLLIIKRTGIVYGAEWHGKFATCAIYAVIVVHLIWKDMPLYFSNSLIVICAVIMLGSSILYGKRNCEMLKYKENTK